MLHLTGSLKMNKFQAMVRFGFVCFCFLLYFYIYVFILCAWRSKDNLLPSVLSSMWVGAWGGVSNSLLKARTLTHLATLAAPGYGFR